MKNSIEVEAALRLALEVLEKMMAEFRAYDLPYGSKAYAVAKDARLELFALLNHSEAKTQKPVAWGMSSAEGGFVVDCITPEEHDRIEGGYTIPLYTTPPPVPETHKRTAAEGEDTQRAWVGLSDKEISEASKHFTQWEGFMHGAYWAQEKLKESNT